MFEIFVQNRSQNDSLFQLFSGDSSDFVLVSVAQVEWETMCRNVYVNCQRAGVCTGYFRLMCTIEGSAACSV